MPDAIARLNAALEGRYAIEREPGEGGMATVYLGEDSKHRRKVAIKVLRPELAATLGADRFVREIDIVARLSHPHILMLIESGDADGLLYYVMPYVDGGSLRNRLDRETTLPLPDAIRITEQVASALTYAHECGVVHRDIKPENILLSRDQAVVADFGIARAIEAAGGERLTETGLAIGTVAYMSPEQAFGESDIDGRTDQYALGCVVYQMLSGQLPFTARTPQALLAKRITGKPRGLRTIDESIPLYAQRAVERALATEPSERFSSPTEFAQTLTSQTVVERVGRRRLAVLPPVNVTGDAEQSHLVLGLHEALISQLSQGDVAVLARTSVLQYQQTEKPVREIARELEVDAVIESSLHRVNDTVGVQARLIDGDSEEGLWAGSYDGDLANVFSLYRDLAGAIAKEIEIALAPPQAQTRADRRKLDPAAYENYMRGRVHQERFTPEDLEHAVQYYQAALEAAPDYAPAHAGIALVWGSRIVLGLTPPLVGGPEWKASALRAVELDPDLAEAHQALASWHMAVDWDWKLAEAAFERSIELDPNDPQTRTFYSHFLAAMTRHDEATAQIERALELDPFNPFHQTMYGPLLLMARRFADADAQLEKALEMAPNNALAHWAFAILRFHQGRFDEALNSAMKYCTLLGDGEVAEALRDGEGRGGFAAAALRAAELLVERSRETYVKPEMISYFFDWAGEIDRAMEWIEKGYELRDHQIAYSAVTPYSDALRADSRFQDIIRRVELPT